MGRNDPCPCGSEKKYKHCCLERELHNATQNEPDAHWVGSSFELGVNYYLQGLHKEASDLFNAVLQQSPDHSLALYYQGFIAYLNRQFDSAEKMLGRAVQLDACNARFQCHYALLAIDQGRYAVAVEHLLLALEIKPDYADALLNLSTAYFHLGDYAQSILWSHKNLEIQPDNARAYHNIGKCLANLRDLNGSVENFERAIQLDPKDVPSYIGLAATHFELKNLNAVSRYCMKAIQLDPNYANAYLLLGMTCREQGNLAAADTFMLQAAALAPQDEVIQSHVAQLKNRPL